MTKTWTMVIEFSGGPLDSWSDHRITDKPLPLPERLVAMGYPPGSAVSGPPAPLGEYLIQVRGVGHYTYRWYEAPRLEAA